MQNPKLHHRPGSRQATNSEPATEFDRRTERLHLPRQLQLAEARGRRHVALSLSMTRAVIRDQIAAAETEARRRLKLGAAA